MSEPGIDDDAELLHEGGEAAGPEALRAGVETLVGQPCWSACVGPDRSIAMDLGEKLRRVQPLKNPQLSDEQRQCIGEYWLLVKCAWRLDGADGVVCASGDGAAPGRIAAGLVSLVGRKVTGFELRAPANDLTLWFGADRRLTIFCDRSAGDGDNYTLAVPGESLGARAGGAVERESRAMPPRPE